MREKMSICLFMLISVLFFVSCGEETDSRNQSQRRGMYGTDLNRQEMRKAVFKPAPSVYKKTPIRPLNTQTWGMISTGQTQCFDNEKQIVCPETPSESRFFYQDRNRFGTRSLSSSNGGQTVLDDITRRLWIKHTKSKTNWYEAKYYCDSLKMLGKKWRLPTTAELRSLVNYGRIDPAIDMVFQSGSTENLSTWFWASDHTHFNSETADGTKLASSWIINFYDGSVEYTSRYNTYSVRCVTEAE